MFPAAVLMTEGKNPRDKKVDLAQLNIYYRRLYINVNIDGQFLEEVRTRINIIEKAEPSEEEGKVISRIWYFWIKRALEVIIKASEIKKPMLALPPAQKNLDLTANDRKFLRALRIGID